MTANGHARSLEIVVEIGEESPFFQGLLEHAGVEGQFGDEELEAVILGFEF
jgi:hypothetical protein